MVVVEFLTSNHLQAQYCTPNNINNYWNFYISNVTLGSIDNSSSGTTGNYKYYSSVAATDITVGETINGSVDITLDGWNRRTNTVVVWMNFNTNEDNDFEDSGERFLFTFKDDNSVSGNKTVNVPISIAVPSTAQLGSSRMRVGLITDSSGFTPCDYNWKSGEVEDYNINFKSNVSSQDTDGDGVTDDVDLDNDNDGILDSQENNILSYGGFENVPVLNNGNNQAGQGVNATTILPWILIPGGLGSGGTPNVVQVDGDVYNYGNGGPPFDADLNTNTVGFKQHYFDINGNADVYQSFKITSTTNITYSGYFSPRDNNNSATAKIAIYSGIGNDHTGATLVTDTGTIAIPIQNGSSKATPWTLVQGTVTLSPGTYSYVVTMSNYGNFDEGSVKVTDSNLDTDGDGIANIYDLDSDNDGIFDAEEAGHGQSNTNGVVSNVVGTDGIPDVVQDSPNSGTINYVVAESLNDSDYILNFLDIDSDGDGIPDNVEAQPTIGYVPPSNVSTSITDSNNNGVDDAYESAMGGTDISQLIDTDGDGIKDYLDTDSDNDGVLDIEENGQANTTTNIDVDCDGLDDNLDAITNYLDVNDEVSTGDINDLINTFGDANGDADSAGDLDYRDDFNSNPRPSDGMLYFNGVDDYLSRNSIIDGLNDVTIMAWVKSDSGNSTNMTIAAEDVACKLWLKDGDIPTFTIRTKDSEKSAGGCKSCNAINFDEWHHLAGSYSSSTGIIKLYIDGALVKTKNIGKKGNPITTSNNANGTFEIGRFSNTLTDGEYFKGNIDEVRIFDTSLTDSQIQQMVYQEIENNSGNIQGVTIQKDIEDISSKNKLQWTDLLAYYPMTYIHSGSISDHSGNGHTMNIHNIKDVQEQTAPLPYKTISDGNWSSQSTWLHGDVWDIGDVANLKDWCIVKISNDITVNNSIITNGLIIDSDRTLTVQGDNLVENSWYFELNGTLDLQGDSQLIQTSTSDLVTSATGKILRRQEGVSSSYWYNYWCSPVGAAAATTLMDNNAATNNSNNTDFRLELLKDGTDFPVQFTTAYSQAGYISTYWLYTYMNGVTYWDWAKLTPKSNIKPGVGYTQKGSGNGGTEEQYIFEGKPNNGTILVDVLDKGGPGSVVSVSATTSLLGNPYPSALDIYKFIDDNKGVIKGDLQLWQQWAGSSHNLKDYEGGYAQVNKLGGVRAYQFVGLNGAKGSQNGTKTPTRYLPVGQGFIVEVVKDGTIEFNNDQRVFIKEADFVEGNYNNGSAFFKSSNTKSKEAATTSNEVIANEIQKIRLDFSSVEGPKAHRELLLGFSDITSDDYDYGYDAECGEVNNNDLNLNLDGKNMNIQAYGPITDDKVIPLNFKSSGNNTFELKMSDIVGIDSSQEIYLKDNMTGEYFDLKQNQAYRFTSEAGKFNKRFEIVFQSEATTLGVEEAKATENFVYYQNNTHSLFVKKLNGSVTRFSLINIAGQSVLDLNDVSQETLNNGLKIPNVQSGTYIAWFRTDTNQVFTKKIIVN
ncbi:hypothetical protein GCM10007962_17520 [Yeosuana aromativorans]|uniref:LamG-like jellyroll fold domain-containing protein n=2 Tax=Yeosuana aromativorans TaxID=288019 RepID=A0A8J3BJE0_9FLAO|nr:hypothetical protein GCM10007962_17520 [Yeosuana aromativorans]